MPAKALVVDSDQATLGLVAARVQASGYDVLALADFEAAVQAWQDETFHALVTAHRLGVHNGLHLVLRAVRERPSTVAIVTTPTPDPALAGEAARFGAICSVAPWNDPSGLMLALRAPGPPAAITLR